MSSQRSEAEAAFQCGQRNSLKTINVDREHFIRFRGKSCVFKFIRLSVDVALDSTLKYKLIQKKSMEIFDLMSRLRLTFDWALVSTISTSR